MKCVHGCFSIIYRRSTILLFWYKCFLGILPQFHHDTLNSRKCTMLQLTSYIVHSRFILHIYHLPLLQWMFINPLCSERNWYWKEIGQWKTAKWMKNKYCGIVKVRWKCWRPEWSAVPWCCQHLLIIFRCDWVEWGFNLSIKWRDAFRGSEDGSEVSDFEQG